MILSAESNVTKMWSMNLQDTEAVVANFYDSCYAAGSTACPLRQSHDSDGQDIKSRLDAFLDTVSRQPIALVESGFAEVITVQDIRNMFQLPLYMPVLLYQSLAKTLAAVLQGNYTGVLSALRGDTPLAADLYHYNGRRDGNYWSTEAALTYICNDGEDLREVSDADWERYVEGLISVSPTLGPFFALFGVSCSGWKIRPAWRFAGPYGWNASLSSAEASDVDTVDLLQHPMDAHKPPRSESLAPIIFLSSRTDPVTPLRNAFAMSELYPGSSVVIQDSFGHCAVWSSPSECTEGIVKAYFANGTMPDSGTVCAPDCLPWKDDEKDVCRNFYPGFGPKSSTGREGYM